jgi:hypothetical protein
MTTIGKHKVWCIFEDGEIDRLEQIGMMAIEHNFIFIPETLFAFDVKKVFGSINFNGHLQTRIIKNRS